MQGKTISAFLLAVWLVLLGAECFAPSPAAPEPLTLGDILALAEPLLEAIEVSGEAKAKAGVAAACETANFPSCCPPGISARRSVEEPLLMENPPRLYKLHRVFLI